MATVFMDTSLHASSYRMLKSAELREWVALSVVDEFGIGYLSTPAFEYLCTNVIRMLSR